MSRQSDEEDTGSQSRTPPSPGTTDPWSSVSAIFGSPMVSAPGADVRPYLHRPPPSPYAPYYLQNPYPHYGAGRHGQTFRSEDNVSNETEYDRIISRLRLDVESERTRRLQCEMQCEMRLQEQHLRECRLRGQLLDLTKQLEEKEKKLKHKLQEREGELAERTRQWKKAAGDLNKLRASAQGFYQITDEYLTGLILGLRFSIQNFALQYFEGKSPKITFFARPPHYLGHVKTIVPGKQAEICAGAHSKRNHQLIQALIWRVLVAEVFNKFAWVGGKASESFRNLRTKLDPAQSNDAVGMKRSEPEAERKFQTWSATTVGLLLDAHSPEEQSRIRQGLEDETLRIAGCLLNTFEAMVKIQEQDVEDGLTNIISEAYVVGKEISRQTARITWMFDLEKEPEIPHVSAVAMELESGQNIKKTQEVNWVVAPGVMKRGKSTGEGFNHEEMLLKSVVSSDE